MREAREYVHKMAVLSYKNPLTLPEKRSARPAFRDPPDVFAALRVAFADRTESI